MPVVREQPSDPQLQTWEPHPTGRASPLPRSNKPTKEQDQEARKEETYFGKLTLKQPKNYKKG